MSQNYNQFKVSELKSILQERGLSHSGTKSELISRLVEHDSSTAASDKKEESTEPATDAPTEPAQTATEAAAEPVAEPTTEATEPAAESTAESTSTESAAKDAGSAPETAESALEPTVEEPKQPTEEELFQTISEDIKTRIRRAKKFGGDASELEARLKRLEKFGVGSIVDSRSKADITPRGGKKRPSRKDKQLRSDGPKPAVD